MPAALAFGVPRVGMPPFGGAAAAAADLAVREAVGTHDVGSWSREEAMRPSLGLEAIIAAWAATQGLDGAVWRAVEPNPPDRSPGSPSEEQRLDYLRRLVATGQEHDARVYFERMPAQIRTPFQVRVAREPGWRSRASIPAPEG